MNPVPDLIQDFQQFVAEVPDLVQPLIVAAAGMIPFIEGEVASVIGLVGGLHPLVAAPAAAAGNFLSVLLVVYLGSGVRSAVVKRSARGGGEPPARMKKFQRAFDRFGVPGVSLLGPLLLPTQFTAAALVTVGVSKGRVLAWQAAAIVLWTSAVTAIATGALSFL